MLEQELFRVLPPLLRDVVSIDNGNCCLTTAVVKGRGALDWVH